MAIRKIKGRNIIFHQDMDYVVIKRSFPIINNSIIALVFFIILSIMSVGSSVFLMIGFSILFILAWFFYYKYSKEEDIVIPKKDLLNIKEYSSINSVVVAFDSDDSNYEKHEGIISEKDHIKTKAIDVLAGTLKRRCHQIYLMCFSLGLISFFYPGGFNWILFFISLMIVILSYVKFELFKFRASEQIYGNNFFEAREAIYLIKKMSDDDVNNGGGEDLAELFSNKVVVNDFSGEGVNV